jgi:hypothetical protein
VLQRFFQAPHCGATVGRIVICFQLAQ